MLLEGKRVLVTGVLTDQSIAFSVARCAQEQGAEIVLTSFGRAMSLTKRVAKRLPSEPDVLELDVTNPEHVAALGAELEQRWGRLDGVLHAIGFAPEACLGGDFLRAGWDDVATAVHVSAYSLKALAEMALPLMKGAGQGDGRGGGSIVGLGGQLPGDPLGQAHGPAERGQDDLRSLLLGAAGHREGDGLIGEDAGDEDALAFQQHAMLLSRARWSACGRRPSHACGRGRPGPRRGPAGCRGGR